ncbi:MAG: precorrin-8X methylmutase [Oscillibacter sp.]|nr:precorrin-8X methylmutase [Oscillibacter sp.]
MEHMRPADIERESMKIIDKELAAQGIVLETETAAVVKRVIHTTADFDYVHNLRFTPQAVEKGVAALGGGVVVTDTNMALSGVSKPALARLGAAAHCFMAEPETAEQAKAAGTTRAAAAVLRAEAEFSNRAVMAVGNAPTALLRIADRMEAGWRPALVIGVPVGFVNVVESKERLWEICTRLGVPAIVALGRKGGSNVAAAICNALLYTATGLLDPSSRNERKEKA